MSSASSERIALRKLLEEALFNYVKTNDSLPSATDLRREVLNMEAYCRYIQARKFILAKIDADTFTVEAIKAGGGKIVKNKDAPAKKPAEEKKDEEKSGNLLKDTVVEATKKEVEEAQKKAEEATPSQEKEVGPVTVKDDAFDNVDVDEETVEKSKAATKAEEKDKQAEEKASYVTRYEISEMSDEDQDRFFAAVATMQKSKNGPGTSEFFRLASYHGYPKPIYCQHGRETFPGWHRIYLLEFEKALQAADKENGNDGQIGIPYWDWTTYSDKLPEKVRTKFSWPDDLFPEDVKPPYGLKRDTDDNIKAKLNGWGTINDAYDCLLATEHYAHASTGDQGQYASVETSHNHLHVIVGGNGGCMSSVAWAAYDIAFWLHHNNVDRIYESYLAIEPDSAEEFENYQEWNRSNGRTDLFDQAFTPFKKPNGEYYYPKDTFDTKKIGYVYDKLLKPRPMQLREAPTLVLFRQVKVYEFESKCYQIHVYIVDKAKEDEFKEPTKSSEIDVSSDNYAGGDGIFGRGMECRNCMTRPPVDLKVDINNTLRKLGISRYEAVVKVYIEETTDDSDVLLRVEDTKLPQPIISGPIFAPALRNNNLDNGKDGVGDLGGPNNAMEVQQVQKYMRRFGYYAKDKKIDGVYGAATTQAVMDFQAIFGEYDAEKNPYGLKKDGVVGPKTKAKILQSRRCGNVDPFANNLVKDEDTAQEPFKSTKITYYIDMQPGYLDRERVEQTISVAFKQWAEGSEGVLEFVFLDDIPSNKEKADVVLSWTAGQSDDDELGFDGVGGILGHGGKTKDGKGFVNFDLAERWVYAIDENGKSDTSKLSILSDPNTWYRGQPTVSLYYVATHEIGHVLGLDHYPSATDMMGPYYTPNNTQLSDNDKQRLQKIYPKK